MALDTIAVVRDWPLPKTQKHIKSFIEFCSYCGKFINHSPACAPVLILVSQELKTVMLFIPSSFKFE
jgi:hypothetical protein